MLLDVIGEALASLNRLPPDQQREHLLHRRTEILAQIRNAPWIIQHLPGVAEFRSLLERIDSIAAPDLPPLLRSLNPWPRQPPPPGPGSTRAGGYGFPDPDAGDRTQPRSLNPWPDDGSDGEPPPPPGPVPRGKI